MENTDNEIRALLIEMRKYILSHGLLMGECVAWRTLKQRFGVAQSTKGWEADLVWLEQYRKMQRQESEAAHA